MQDLVATRLYAARAHADALLGQRSSGGGLTLRFAPMRAASCYPLRDNDLPGRATMSCVQPWWLDLPRRSCPRESQMCLTPTIATAALILLLAGCSVSERSGLRLAGASTEKSESTATCDGGQVCADDQLSSNPDPGVQDCHGGECWWTAERAGCRSAGAPTPSDRPKDSGSGEDIAPIYLGWNHISTGDTEDDGELSEAWQNVGLDLDGVCTNSSTCDMQESEQSCRAQSEMIPYDGLACRDNRFGAILARLRIIPDVAKRFGFSEALLNCNLHRGSYTVVLKVSAYNGTANDSEVRIDVYSSPGVVTALPWECSPDDSGASYPLWRASAAFKIDSNDLVDPMGEAGNLPDSKMADPNAYVRDGYLVAHFPDGYVTRLAPDDTRTRGLALKSQQSILTGRLYRAQDATWHIRDGIVAGRIRSDDLIQTFRALGVCPGVGVDSFYDLAVALTTENADVLADGTDASDRACDAVSFGIGYEAAQLTVGKVVDAPPVVECCASGLAIEDCSPECGDGRKNGDERCDIALSAGEPGACPATCKRSEPCSTVELVGSGCDTECKATPITAIGEVDGCCPSGADATSDVDCTAVCGNSVIEAGETCDPTGSCPKCSIADRCLVVASSGSPDTCNVSCTISPVTVCQEGDECCPNGCSPQDDSDCSRTCGNGIVDDHESCDGSGDAACPRTCDDGDPCTTDYMTGSPGNCNVTCTFRPVLEARSGDGCCPKGASANTDRDCAAECGNKTVEVGEECDDGNRQSGDGCGPDCKVESPVEQCVAQLNDDGNPACARCNCTKCQDLVLDCYASPNNEDNGLCSELIACGQQQGCAEAACYCGTVPMTTCIFGVAEGPCREEVERAAGTTVPGELVARSDDADYPLGRANALSACVREHCAAECAP